jgi:hypothetical protein
MPGLPGATEGSAALDELTDIMEPCGISRKMSTAEASRRRFFPGGGQRVDPKHMPPSSAARTAFTGPLAAAPRRLRQASIPSAKQRVVPPMIGLDRFGEKRELATGILRHVSAELTALLGVESSLDLVGAVDDTLLSRMEEIEEEIFRIEDNVYTEGDLRERLLRKDALLLVLTVGGKVEGYLFGYADEPGNPVVQGSDYFVDSAAISLAYEAKGIGGRLSLPVLFLIHLLGYGAAGLTTEEQDKTGRKLASFYRKIGFVDAPVNREGDVGIGLVIELTPEALKRIAGHLPHMDYLADALGA